MKVQLDDTLWVEEEANHDGITIHFGVRSDEGLIWLPPAAVIKLVQFLEGLVK